MSVNLQEDPHSSDRDSTEVIGGSHTGQRSKRPRRASRYDLVVMAASVGGMKALHAVLSALPDDFPVPIAVVPHRSNRFPNLLAQILACSTPLTVKMAEQSEAMQPGTVYLGCKLLYTCGTVENDHLSPHRISSPAHRLFVPRTPRVIAVCHEGNL